MKMNFTRILIVVLIIVTSCKKTDPNKQIDEGNVAENVYSSKKIG